MKSAHKLAAGLAALVTLLVAAYFILMALNTAIKLHPSATLSTPSSPAQEEPAASTSAPPETSTQLRLDQSRLVELTTRAPGSADKSLVHTLEVKSWARTQPGEQLETTIIKEPAMTVEVIQPLEAAGSSAAPSGSTSASPTAPPTSSEARHTTEASSSETPITLPTLAPSTTTTTASPTTPTHSSQTRGEAWSVASSEQPASSQTASSEQSAASESTSTTTTSSPSSVSTSEVSGGGGGSSMTTPQPAQSASGDSEKLYRETTAMPAEGLQMAPEEERAWQEFKQAFRRAYGSLEEEKARANKFVGNLRFINAHNRLPEVSFQLGINQFADMTPDEINAKHIGPLVSWASTLAGSGQTRPPQMRILEEEQTGAEGGGGRSIDWRNATTRMPLDQALCPESALFSVIASLEASLELAGFKGVRLSPKQLMDCLAYSAPPPPNWPPVCSGQLSMVTLWEFLQRQAIRLLPEPEYEQFRAAQMQGLAPAQTCVPPLAAGMRDTRPRIVSYHQVPGEHIEEALQNRGPLVVALDASKPSFHFYKSGLYHELQCSSDQYNLHALLVASHSADNSTGVPGHFTLRASLGPTWGETGHMRLLKEPARNKCLPEQLATYPDLGFE